MANNLQSSDQFWPGRFAGQVGVVTGGEIGLATTRQLLREGAKVYFCDIDLAKAENMASQLRDEGLAQVVSAKLDVTSDEQVGALFDRAVEESGQVHFALNSAGISDTADMRAPIWKLDMDQFRLRQEVNLVGSAIVTKHAARVMIPNKYGRIVLIASVAGKEGNVDMTAYSSSKGGVIALVKAAGQELHGHGILVNGFAPAVIRTSMVDGMDPEVVALMENKILMGRCGELDEAAYKLCHTLSRRNSFQTRFIEDMTGGRADY